MSILFSILALAVAAGALAAARKPSETPTAHELQERLTRLEVAERRRSQFDAETRRS